MIIKQLTCNAKIWYQSRILMKNLYNGKTTSMIQSHRKLTRRNSYNNLLTKPLHKLDSTIILENILLAFPSHFPKISIITI